MNEVSTSFTDAVAATRSSCLVKKTYTEKKREKINLHKKITKSVNTQFAENAAISMLTEGESKRKYHRKRLAQSFRSPEQQPQPAKKKRNRIHPTSPMYPGTKRVCMIPYYIGQLIL